MPRFGNIWICCLGSESVPCRTALQWLKEDHQPTFPSASCFVFLSPWIVFVHLSDDNQGKVSIWQTFSKKKRPNKPQTCQHPPPSRICLENMEMPENLSRDNKFPGCSHIRPMTKLKVWQSSREKRRKITYCLRFVLRSTFQHMISSWNELSSKCILWAPNALWQAT